MFMNRSPETLVEATSLHFDISWLLCLVCDPNPDPELQSNLRMDRLLSLARSLIVAQGKAYLLKQAYNELHTATVEHVPLGGSTTIQFVFDMLTWKDLLVLSQCSSACQATVCALFGTSNSPLCVIPRQLPFVFKGKTTRYTRALRVDCSDMTTVNEESMDSIRQLPLLRSLTFAPYPAEDSELLVMLSRNPRPELLQHVRLEDFAELNEQTMNCFRTFPSLHTLQLIRCTLNDESVLSSLPNFPHLTCLSLNFTPGHQFHSDSLLPILQMKKLSKLHLHTLAASQSLLPPILTTMFSSPLFTTQLEHLSLCYINLFTKNPLLHRHYSQTYGRDRSDSSELKSCPRIAVPELSADLWLELQRIESLELSWVSPLDKVLPAALHMPKLRTLLLGDDHIQLVEEVLQDSVNRFNTKPGTASPGSFSTADRAELPQLVVYLYGFVGVRKQRFDELKANVEMCNDQGCRSRITIQYVGESRRSALRTIAPLLEWANETMKPIIV